MLWPKCGMKRMLVNEAVSVAHLIATSFIFKQSISIGFARKCWKLYQLIIPLPYTVFESSGPLLSCFPATVFWLIIQKSPWSLLRVVFWPLETSRILKKRTGQAQASEAWLYHPAAHPGVGGTQHALLTWVCWHAAEPEICPGGFPVGDWSRPDARVESWAASWVNWLLRGWVYRGEWG